MSKIAIISQPDKGVLIDVGGCTTLQEACQHLTSTLQISSQFWNGMNVELNLGNLQLTPEEVSQVMAIASEVGVKPGQVFASNELTKAGLIAHNIKIAYGKPMSLPKVTIIEEDSEEAAVCEVTRSAQPEAIEILKNEETTACAGSAECATTQVEGTQQAPAAPPEPAATSGGATPVSPQIVEEAPAAGAPAAATSPLEAAVVVPAAVEPSVTVTAPESSPQAPAEQTTAAAAPAAVKPAVPQPPAVLYLRQTLRSGQAVSHQGHLVIIGDVNPGAEVMAEGDITVWGALRGVAHAGISGNTSAEIRALRIQAIQLRIATAIARSPDRPRKKNSSHSGPETARIVNGSIRIAANIPE